MEECNASMQLQLWDGKVLMAMALIINKVLTDMELIDDGPCAAGHAGR